MLCYGTTEKQNAALEPVGDSEYSPSSSVSATEMRYRPSPRFVTERCNGPSVWCFLPITTWRAPFTTSNLKSCRLSAVTDFDCRIKIGSASGVFAEDEAPATVNVVSFF